MLYFSAGTEIDDELCGGHLSHREQDGNPPLDLANRSQEVRYATQCSDPETSLGCTEWVCTQDPLLLSWRLGNAKETHSPLPIGLLGALSVLPSQHRYGPVYDPTNSKSPWSFPYPCSAVVSNPAAWGCRDHQSRSLRSGGHQASWTSLNLHVLSASRLKTLQKYLFYRESVNVFL